MAFGGAFIDDAFARFAKVTILLSAAAILLISQDYMAKRDLLRFEYPILLALAVVGMMMMVSAGDLMALYMGLELQSLALYVVASLRRDSVISTEAGLKYFVLGALSSGLLLYGASLTYGFAGTTLFAGIITTVEGGAYVDRAAVRPCVHRDRPRVQGIRCAVPYVDAGCLRRLPHAGHGVLCDGPEGRRDGPVRAGAA